MLGIWLSLCQSYGIADVLVNTHAHAMAIADFVSSQTSAVRVTIVEEQELVGSAGALRANRQWTQSEERFWVLYADVLTCGDLRSMLAFHSSSTAATLGVYPVPDPLRCGIVSVDGQDTILEFTEKPAFPKGNLAFAGIMVGTQEFLDAIPEKPGADIGFDVLPRLGGRMRAYRIPEYVLDIGTRENYELAQKTWPGLAGDPAA